jgi:hypothetical protein
MQLLCSLLWAAMAQCLEFTNEQGAKAPPEDLGLCMCRMLRVRE